MRRKILALVGSLLSAAVPAHTQNDPLAILDGTWASVNPPGVHITFSRVGIDGRREASLPFLGRASVTVSSGEHGSHLKVSGQGFDCYYWIGPMIGNENKMSWELKGGKPLCLESMTLERVGVGGRHPQKHEAAPLKEDLDRLTREVERLKREASDELVIADRTRRIETNPRDSDAYYDLGNAYSRKGDYDRAIANYTKAIVGRPGDAYRARGAAYASKGDFKRAIIDYSTTLLFIRMQRDASVWSDRAWAYLMVGKAAQALSDAERSLELRPDHAPTLNTRGHILEALGRRQEAIADFRRALELDPTIQASKDALKRLGAAP